MEPCLYTKSYGLVHTCQDDCWNFYYDINRLVNKFFELYDNNTKVKMNNAFSTINSATNDIFNKIDECIAGYHRKLNNYELHVEQWHRKFLLIKHNNNFIYELTTQIPPEIIKHKRVTLYHCIYYNIPLVLKEKYEKDDWDIYMIHDDAIVLYKNNKFKFIIDDAELILDYEVVRHIESILEKNKLLFDKEIVYLLAL